MLQLNQCAVEQIRVGLVFRDDIPQLAADWLTMHAALEKIADWDFLYHAELAEKQYVMEMDMAKKCAAEGIRPAGEVK